jgi:hypothetical protein
MLHLYWTRVLNARQLCEQMHLAHLAGIAEARMYALGPGAKSGHYQRKLDSVLGGRAEGELYELPVPGHGKHDLERQVHSCWVLVPHEEMAADMAKPGFATLLGERLEGMPQAYWQHPLVIAEGERSRVAPLALYLDGVPYSITDSVIGFWLICLTTSKRYLFAVFRKRLSCQCGCKAWCSFHAFFTYVRWTLLALAQGVMPTHRHDGTTWRDTDLERSLLAGTSLPFKACVIYIKGDWAEYAHTLGFPTWRDGIRPCFECNAFGENLYDTLSHSCDALNWRCNEDADYDATCSRCELPVRLRDEAARQMVLRVLRPDKRTNGSQGLALASDLPSLGLVANDRLEPSAGLPDVHALDVVALPADVIFWRPSLESLARHRNPLFCNLLGMSPKRSLTIDALHALYLGVMKSWCVAALWYILLSGMYGAIGTAEENLAAALLGLRHDLMQWYKDSSGEFPYLTRLSDLTAKMIGKPLARRCKTKGAETWGFMLFLISVLTRSSAFFGAGGAAYLTAGRHLKRVVDIWHEHGTNVPPSAVQDRGGINHAHVTDISHALTLVIYIYIYRLALAGVFERICCACLHHEA